MKIPVVLVVLAFARAASAQTQAEMTQEAIDDFRKADAQLNVAYGKAKAALDAEGQAKLKTAQRAWIVFRDAQADLEADTAARGGTMAPLIACTTKKQLTEDRTSELEELVKTKAGQ